jgi:hypothetical protein
MIIRLLTYEFNQEKSPEDFEGIAKVIADYDYIKLSESSYALETNESPSEIYYKLEPFIDKKDSVLVFTITEPFFGVGAPNLLTWLRSRL